MKTKTIRERVIPEALVLVAVAVGLLLGVGAGPGHAQQVQDEQIASPGVFAVVVAETAKSGWPHAVTEREKDRITRRVITTNVIPGHAGSATCAWPSGYVSPVRCTTVVLGVGRSERQVVLRYTSRLRIYEDGSWTQFRIR